MIDDCIFCQIVKGKIPSDIVYETDEIFAFLDINPVNLGHALVIPKKHFENLIDTPDEIACEMMKAAKKIGKALEKAIDAEGFNLGLNNGPVAGQAVYHVHLHVMPRFTGDGLELWKSKETSPEQRKSAADKIKAEL